MNQLRAESANNRTKGWFCEITDHLPSTRETTAPSTGDSGPAAFLIRFCMLLCAFSSPL